VARTFQNKPFIEAVERIESYINDNKLAPQDRLPSERDLCEMWEMNRTTLRSAIRTLIDEGKLYNKVGSGTFVAEPKLTRNLQDMLPLAKLAASHGKKLHNKVLSARVMECNKQVSQKLHLPLGHKLFELIRLRSIDDDPILIETAYIDCVRHSGIERVDFEKESLYSCLEKKFGTVVRKGQEQLGITYATEKEARLLGIQAESPLFHLIGTASEEDGTPVEYFESVQRVDKIRFASVLTRNVKKGKKT
jgi:GntR family transcriptional regulator